jgi:hypothetical protein
MLSYYLTANLKNPQKRGGLAIFGKTHAATGFEGLGMPTFHRKVTENSPKKNEVSDFGFLTPCYNWLRGGGGLRL